MRVATWNVNGLAPTVANVKLHEAYRSLSGFLSALGDVVCLQEVKLNEEKVTREYFNVEGWESFWAISRSKKGYSGVTTWVASPAYSPVAGEVDCLGSGNDDEINQEGRVVVTDHQSFVLIGVYVPNAGCTNDSQETLDDRPRIAKKVRFLRALKSKADSFLAAGRKVILVGDFNVAMTHADVHPSVSLEASYGSEELEIMHSLTRDYVDAWRSLHPEVLDQFTVWDERTAARTVNKGVRIDFILVSRNMMDQLVSCEIVNTSVIPPKWSDHAAVVATFRDVPLVAPHQPIMCSSLRDRRWNAQRTIKSMFSAAKKDLKRPAESEARPSTEARPSIPAGAHQPRVLSGSRESGPHAASKAGTDGGPMTTKTAAIENLYVPDAANGLLVQDKEISQGLSLNVASPGAMLTVMERDDSACVAETRPSHPLRHQPRSSSGSGSRSKGGGPSKVPKQRSIGSFFSPADLASGSSSGAGGIKSYGRP